LGTSKHIRLFCPPPKEKGEKNSTPLPTNMAMENGRWISHFKVEISIVNC